MALLVLGDEAHDENGNVKIRIITDGSWQKRYGRNSLFGYGVMYGFYTGKVVFVSHRCCRCMTCISWIAVGKEVPEHQCTKEWLKLPELTNTLFDSRKPCAVSMAALKVYFAQYEKYRKMRKECGTYGKD